MRKTINNKTYTFIITKDDEKCKMNISKQDLLDELQGKEICLDINTNYDLNNLKIKNLSYQKVIYDHYGKVIGSSKDYTSLDSSNENYIDLNCTEFHNIKICFEVIALDENGEEVDTIIEYYSTLPY